MTYAIVTKLGGVGMGSKNHFSPLEMLSAILDKHEGRLDPSTITGYLSHISFLSLLNIYQNIVPGIQQPSNALSANNPKEMLSRLLNKDLGDSSEGLAAMLSSLGGQKGISSLLSSMPIDNLSSIFNMLGNSGESDDTFSSNSLKGKNQLDYSSLLPLLSMFGSGGGKSKKSKRERRNRKSSRSRTDTFPFEQFAGLLGKTGMFSDLAPMLGKIGGLTKGRGSANLLPALLPLLMSKSFKGKKKSRFDNNVLPLPIKNS